MHELSTSRVMKQVVLFFEIKFTTVVKITFRKRGQMRQANVNGRKIYKYKYINNSTRSSNSRANTKNPCIHVSTNFSTYSANATKN